jgi:hypothetical protein
MNTSTTPDTLDFTQLLIAIRKVVEAHYRRVYYARPQAGTAVRFSPYSYD